MSVTTAPELPEGEPRKAIENLAGALSALGETGPTDAVVHVPVEAVAAGMRAGNVIVQALGAFTLLAARGIIAPFEVLARYQIGERYLSFPIIVAAASILGGIALLDVMDQDTLIAIAGLFVLLRIVHALAAFIRDRRGGYWHSYSEGISILRIPPIDRFFHRWNFTFDFSKLFLEPAVLLGAAAHLNYGTYHEPFFIPGFLGGGLCFFSSFACYVAVVGVTLFFFQLYCWNRRRQALLDEKDARVEMEARALASAPNQPPGIQSHRGVAYSPALPKTAWTR